MTEKSMFGVRPGWVSDELFPFESRFFDSPRGRMHYVDEGDGEPIVFVHGNPSWSFEFRDVIRELRGRYRCIASDHIGFGLSERSELTANYHPKAHAENFAALLDHLELQDVSPLPDRLGRPYRPGFRPAQSRPGTPTDNRQYLVLAGA